MNAAGVREDLLNCVRGQYIEMPGLRLTLAQAARLLDLDQDLARTVLATLVASGFLILTSSGKYCRRQSQ